jgi:hypothetical protein
LRSRLTLALQHGCDTTGPVGEKDSVPVPVPVPVQLEKVRYTTLEKNA